MVVLNFSVSLLIFCLVSLEVVERGVLMSPAIVVDLPMSPFCLVFTSHALQLCLVHTHLGLLYLLGILTHYIMSLVVFFALKSTLPNINIVITAAFHSLKFA